MPWWTNPKLRQIRWSILALLFLVTVINFVDRLTLSYVAPILKDTFHLSNTDYGFIVSSFLFGMMIGEFPMAWIMDRRGPRFGFSLAVIWWSIANALHAFAHSKWQFAFLRGWMGTGECGNYPGGVKVIGMWFPPRERALAIGIMNGASLVGSMITPPLIVLIIARLNWQAAFLIPSLLGLLWVVVWRAFYADPQHHPRVEAEELRLITAGGEVDEPALRTVDLLRRREAWGLMLCRLLVGPVIQFYLFWLPEYLYRTRGYSMALIGLLGILPPLFGDLGSVGGGWLSGRLIAGGFSLRRARQTVMAGGAALCALSVVVVLAKLPLLWWGAICLVYFGHYALSANMFATVADYFPNQVTARMTSLTGIAGGFSGWLFPLLTGYLIDRVSYTPVFVLVALMPAAGVGVLFLLLGRRDGTIPAPEVQAVAEEQGGGVGDG
jgi:ACS family hexuronate transporter-like MFS transporter